MRFLSKLKIDISHIKQDRWRRRLLIAWSVFPVVEILTSQGLIRPPTVQESILEIFVCLLLGLVHAAKAPEGWRASAMWPAALGTALTLIRFVIEVFDKGFDSLLAAVPLIALGILVFFVGFVRFLDGLLWKRIPAAVLSLSLPLLLRLALMGPMQIFLPFSLPASSSQDGPPIVLVSVDALRADAALSMKTFDRLSRLGASWKNASSTSSWTWPAVVSLLSGVEAQTHRSGRESHKQSLELRAWDPSVPMLPAQLQARHYVTAAFVTNPVIDLMALDGMFDHWQLGNTLGIPLAFTGFPGSNSDGGDAADIIDAAIDWIESAPATGWFVWIHLYEPHLPYRHAASVYDYNLLRNARTGDWFIGKKTKAAIKNAYLREVEYADQHLQRLVDLLDTKGVLENGVVVFTSDHGEEFWDHGGFEHGHSHHQEVVDVPLVFVGRGVRAERRDDPASLVDIAATIRAILGMTDTTTGLDLRAPIPPDRVVRTYGNAYFTNMESVRQYDKKVIVNGDEIQAYDLTDDPLEKHPLPDAPKILKSLNAGAAAPNPSPSTDNADRGVPLEALRALGYIH